MTDLTPFLQKARHDLWPYLAGVDGFLQRMDTSAGMPSSALRSQSPDAYIANIMAVGIINSLNKAAFDKTTHKIIVLPECVKDYGDWECCKIEAGDSHVCAQCTPDCLVYKTVGQFADSQTEVVLDPDDLVKYFRDAKADLDNFGVVGVACALTLLSGFQFTQKLKLPTQGVFLNYSSCAHHWAKEPYNTCFSLRRMASVLGKEAPIDDAEANHSGETYSLEYPPLSPGQFYSALDTLVAQFAQDYLPTLQAENDSRDIFELSLAVSRMLVPTIITRDSV